MLASVPVGPQARIEHSVARGTPLSVSSVAGGPGRLPLVGLSRNGVLVAGVNGAGLLVAALGSGAADGGGAVAALLGEATGTAAAVRLAAERFPGVALRIAAETEDVIVPPSTDRENDTSAAAGAAITLADGVHIRLGPASTGVPVRHWPGIPSGPQATAPDGGETPMAALARQLVTLLEEHPERAADVTTTLDAVRAAALTEGVDAERQASLMEGAGDGSGAMIRRVLAVSYALRLAVDASRSLLGEAAGPSL